MTTLKELLLETLDDLGDDDLKVFQWFLQQADVLEGFPAVPRSRLEKADRLDTVDQMVRTYSRHALDVTKKVLVKINRNDLVQNLPDVTSGSTGWWWEDELCHFYCLVFCCFCIQSNDVQRQEVALCGFVSGEFYVMQKSEK